jgi:hypothetical protein
MKFRIMAVALLIGAPQALAKPINGIDPGYVSPVTCAVSVANSPSTGQKEDKPDKGSKDKGDNDKSEKVDRDRDAGGKTDNGGGGNGGTHGGGGARSKDN